MRKGLLIAGAVVAAAVIYLFAWPVPVEPVAWSAPESAGYGGAHPRHERPARAPLVKGRPQVGPRDTALVSDGQP